MSILREYFAQVFPPKSKFSVDDIPDLTGKVIVVTGGNGGIGYETVKALLSKNAKVYMASRSKERAGAAIAQLKAETGREAIFLQLDLASFGSVRKAADELKSKETALHVLFNNGGVMATPIEQLTEDGYDLQFGTNVMGHYVFTKRLLPLLIAGAKSSSDNRARIVNTSSIAQIFTNTIHFDGLKDVPLRKKLGSNKMYLESKLGVVLFSNELAKRYGDSGIVSTSLNPGNLKTNLQQNLPGAFMLLLGWMYSPPSLGALTQLWAGVSPETVDYNGKYLIPWARMGDLRPEIADSDLGKQLWEWLEKETND